VIVHWDQHSCHLICAGDSRFIKIWDVETETKLTALSTVPTGSIASAVTCLSMQSKGTTTTNYYLLFIN